MKLQIILLALIGLYFALQFAQPAAQGRTQPAPAAATRPEPQAAPAPSCAAEVRRLVLSGEVLVIEAGGNAQAVRLAFDNGLTITRRASEVCSFGECRLTVGSSPGPFRVQFDQCPQIEVTP